MSDLGPPLPPASNPAPASPPSATPSIPAEPADSAAARLTQRLEELCKHLAAAEATLNRLDALVVATPPITAAAPGTTLRRPAVGMSAALPPAPLPAAPQRPASGDRKAVADYLRAKRAMAE